MDGLGEYLHSLIGSWEALATPHASARVVRGGGFAACRHPHQVFNNGFALTPEAIGELQEFFDGVDSYALWSRDGDRPTVSALEAAGYQRDWRHARCAAR